ncbi:hypothetical protein LPJ81_003975 [Coemansia sp. IMI 209127]|nr:hypothetical protein LPJ81_003975 [Coemansia sp. IMI 209127]
MAPSHSESNTKNVAAPQPIPMSAASARRGNEQQHQQGTSPPSLGEQYRRNSFTGWSQSFFGIPQAGRAQQPQPPQEQQAYPTGESLPTGIPYPQMRSYSLSSEASAGAPPPPPGNASSFSSAFSGMGILRRLSVSNGAPQQQQQQQMARAPLVSQDALGQATSNGQQQQQHIGLPEFHKSSHHPQPRVLDEMRGKEDDPPSRPDSRMRNLMLSGQFLI